MPAYRLLQGMIALTRSHPRKRVHWTCGVALDSCSFRYQTRRRLVEQSAIQAPRPNFTQQHGLIRDLRQCALLS